MNEMLKKIGISENTIKQMEEMCPNIIEMSKEEIIDKINILKKVKCDNIQIRNIISSNAMYLDRSNSDVEKLIKKLEQYGFDMLNILFDGNPYILNLDAFEIERYINKRKEEGEKIEDIVDNLSTNLYLFEEI